MASMAKWYAVAFFGRVVLVIYGLWQDANMAVKYTDVDYYVFADAADLVSKGKSPYERATYRYTPLLAWLLSLNAWFSPVYGKMVFVVFDILVGRIIYAYIEKTYDNHKLARNCSLLWLLNPLTATVSTRGNAESIMAYLVLASLTFLCQRRICLAAFFYALAIHFKIYPIAYAPAIYLYLGRSDRNSKQERGVVASLATLLPNKERLVFAAVSASVLVSLTGLFCWMYEWPFVYETYLYHIVRGDIRHNFSPYFYLLYLFSGIENGVRRGVPLCLRLLLFVPQVVLLITVAAKYHRNQALSWFLSTFVFVMANKVCTSQYFLWYLSLLPLIIPHLEMSMKKACIILTLWTAGQAAWLLPAYYLEFEGLNTFLHIWAAGLAFFVCNGSIFYIIVTSYKIKRNVE